MRQIFADWRLWLVAIVCVVMFGGFTMIPLWLAAAVFLAAAWISAAVTKQPANAWAWLMHFVVVLALGAGMRLMFGMLQWQEVQQVLIDVLIAAVLASNAIWLMHLMMRARRAESGAGAEKPKRMLCCPQCGNTKGFGKVNPPARCSLCHANPWAFVARQGDDDDAQPCQHCGLPLVTNTKFCPFCGKLAHPDPMSPGWDSGGLQPR